MKIWIRSCHAALEYDQAKMFCGMGHDVTGIFDVGSKQRPKIAGVTDYDQPGTVHEAGKTGDYTLPMFGGSDIVVHHQIAGWTEHLKKIAALDIPVVQILFGQGSYQDHIRHSEAAKADRRIWTVAYALKEYEMHIGLGTPNLFFIRFWKDKVAFPAGCAWRGGVNSVFIPHNSVHQRGDGCGWPIIEKIRRAGVPVILAGKDTDQVGGIGELTYAKYIEHLTACDLYFSAGTVPAPYTLTFTEAIGVGTPTVAWDNKHGLHLENLGIPFFSDVDELIEYMFFMLNSITARRELAKTVRAAHKEHFYAEDIESRWRYLFEKIKEGGAV